MSSKYDDIIGLPIHEPDPVRHPRMPREARAAQFGVFAALKGYHDLVDETADQVAYKAMNETVFEDIDDI